MRYNRVNSRIRRVEKEVQKTLSSGKPLVFISCFNRHSLRGENIWRLVVYVITSAKPLNDLSIYRINGSSVIITHPYRLLNLNKNAVITTGGTAMIRVPIPIPPWMSLRSEDHRTHARMLPNIAVMTIQKTTLLFGPSIT